MSPRTKSLLPVFLRPRALWRFLRDPRASRGTKLLLVLAVAYALFPADLLPDVIPILGWIDDVGIGAAVVTYLARQVARHEAQALPGPEASDPLSPAASPDRPR